MRNIKSFIIKNGGATLNHNGAPVKLKSGYQVSVHDVAIIPLKYFSRKVFEMIMAYERLKRGDYMGLWIEDDKVFIDVSRRIATKREALRVGREYRQRAIYDWRNEKAVRV